MKFPLIFLMSSFIKSQTYTQDAFVQKTMSIILSKTKLNINYDQQIQILRIIYNEMNFDINNRLLLFMSVVLNKTDFLTKFEDRSDTQKYKSRGLLFIKGEFNYKDLKRYSNMYDYDTNPEVLSSLKGAVIKDTIDFFDRALKRNYTFDNYSMCFDDYDNKEEIRDIYNLLKTKFSDNKII